MRLLSPCIRKVERTRCIPIVQVRAGNVYERRGCERHVHRALSRFERMIYRLPLHRKASARRCSSQILRTVT